MTKFLNYLNEKTFDINQDVDFIYNEGFKKWIDLYNKNFEIFQKKISKKRKNQDMVFKKIKSKSLKSKTSKEASDINPVLIYCGIFDNGSIYNFKNNIIQISLNPYVINIWLSHKENEYLPLSIKNEMDSSTIKDSIYHELSHWLNETLHNKAVSRDIKQSTSKGNISDINFSFMELDAQIHGLKQLKRDYKKNWDFLTWTEIITRNSSWKLIFKQLLSKDKKFIEDYRKRLIARLNREGLLGKNLKNSFYDALTIIKIL